MRVNSRLALIGSLQFGISGPLDCHVWAIRGGDGVVVVDAGGGTHTERILANLAADFGEAPVVALVLTHSHPDHCFGAAAIAEAAGCRVFAPEPSREILETGDAVRCGLRLAQQRGVYPADFQFRACKVDRAFRDGDTIEPGGLRITTLRVRGHSQDSFCLLLETGGERWLFSGDAVFYGGVLGVTNIEGSGMEGYRADLPKLAGLGVDAFLPGHGLFTMREGQRHIDAAIGQAAKNFMPRQIGQWDLLF